MFCIDLSETSTLPRKFWLFLLGVYKFRESDHLALRTRKLKTQFKKVLLVTNVRTFGHLFNPVSFYFCFGDSDEAVLALAEVNNTFGESKIYELNETKGVLFSGRFSKHFYISPFISSDSDLNLRLFVPGKILTQVISVQENERPILYTALNGTAVDFTNLNLLKLTISFPLVTLFTILRIHMNAAILYLKGVPYFKKAEQLSLQKDFYKKANRDGYQRKDLEQRPTN